MTAWERANVVCTTAPTVSKFALPEAKASALSQPLVWRIASSS